MSYCVHCGVELHPTARVCPLCSTPVVDPSAPAEAGGPKPFPTQKTEVTTPSKKELALLLTVMFLSAAVCCGVLNLFLRPQRMWSLYVLGAVVMLWVWFVPPLILRGMPLWFRLFLDGLAVGTYVLLIAIDLDGLEWFMGLALPIILLGDACVLFLGALLPRRSILSGVTLLIGTVGVFLVGVELFIDMSVRGAWVPGWSIVVLVVCVALIIPLVVVRRVPNLREEARRRFHM